MNRSLFFALSASAVLLAPASLRADTVPTLAPIQTFQLAAGISNGASDISDPFLGSNTYNGPVSAMGTMVKDATSALGGADPSVSASAQVSGNTYYGRDVFSDSYLYYTLEVTGPAGQRTLVDIAASGGASSTPGSGALAVLDVETSVAGPIPPNELIFLYGYAATGVLESNPSLGAVPSFSGNGVYSVLNNYAYTIFLESSVEDNLVTGAFSASAFVDPSIKLDPSATTADHLYFSSDLGAPASMGGSLAATPEPSTLALLGTGMLGLVGFVKQKRTHTR